MLIRSIFGATIKATVNSARGATAPGKHFVESMDNSGRELLAEHSEWTVAQTVNGLSIESSAVTLRPIDVCIISAIFLIRLVRLRNWSQFNNISSMKRDIPERLPMLTNRIDSF